MGEDEKVRRRARRRRLRETYKEQISQGDASIIEVMKVLDSVNEIGILIDASISWLEHETRNLRNLGFDTSEYEAMLKTLEVEFDNYNHLKVINIVEELGEKIKEKNLEYFQNGSTMIVSSLTRRIMEYEGVGVKVAPLKKANQEVVEGMRNNDWDSSYMALRRLNTAFSEIEQAIEEGTEETLDLDMILKEMMEEGWEIDVQLQQVQSLMDNIPIADADKTFSILANIKTRIMNAKENGKDVSKAIETFKKSEPELQAKDHFKALIWAKIANDELLLIDN